ncbi:RINGv [Musa troglodytarum]|uniref:RINGv n=1 Tax=Musa troglodytarum TaxID=320322 RepID=A0A9E7GHB3_9LILI|nr:RINGv [Musa troglodytarum]
MADKGGISPSDIEGGHHLPPSDESDQDSDDEAGHSPQDPSCEISASPEPCRKSGVSVSDGSLEGDLESGASESKTASPERGGRDCRICHLSLEKASPDAGAPIELGCSCKDDLAAAHKQCAEAWFKIKTCEVCGSIAENVVGSGETEPAEHWNEAPSSSSSSSSETHSFWQGHRFLNLLLACLVFAFVISWLFHFNVPG